MKKAILIIFAMLAPISMAWGGEMQITQQSDRTPTTGSAEYFTGNVNIKPLYPANEHTTSTGALVEFAMGARSAWHTHPAGQTLIVITGSGWVQQEDEEKRRIEVGDVIWTPPGVKHWHGATDKAAMSHIAITNVKDGKNVQWMEKVGDEQYLD